MTASVFCDYRCHPPPGSTTLKNKKREDDDEVNKGGSGKAFGFCNVAGVLAVGEGGGVQFYGEEVSSHGVSGIVGQLRVV